MEACLKLLPHKSYNNFGLLFLTLFVSIGIVVIGIASSFDSKSTMQCNPNKTLELQQCNPRERLVNKEIHRHTVSSEIRSRIHSFIASPQPVCDKFWTCALTQYYLRLFGERSRGNICKPFQCDDEYRRRGESTIVWYFKSSIGPYGTPKF